MQYFFEKISGICWGNSPYNTISFILVDIPEELEPIPCEFLFYNFELQIVELNNDRHPSHEWINGAKRYKQSLLRQFILPRIEKLKEYYLAGGVFYNGQWMPTSNAAMLEYQYFYTNYKADNLAGTDTISFGVTQIEWRTITNGKVTLTYNDLNNIIALMFQLRVAVHMAYDAHINFIENNYPGEQYDFFAHWPAVAPGVIPESF